MSDQMRVMIVRDGRGELIGLFCRNHHDEAYHRNNRAFEKEIVAIVPIDEGLKDYPSTVEALCHLDALTSHSMPISGLLGLLFKLGYEAGLAARREAPSGERRSLACPHSVG